MPIKTIGLASLVALIDSSLEEIGMEIILLASALGAAGFLYRKVLKPGVLAIKNAVHAYELLTRAGERLDSIDEKLSRGEKRFERIEKRFEVIADADALRIKDAVAGEARSPVDRRSSAT